MSTLTYGGSNRVSVTHCVHLKIVRQFYPDSIIAYDKFYCYQVAKSHSKGQMKNWLPAKSKKIQTKLFGLLFGRLISTLIFCLIINFF